MQCGFARVYSTIGLPAFVGCLFVWAPSVRLVCGFTQWLWHWCCSVFCSVSPPLLVPTRESCPIAPASHRSHHSVSLGAQRMCFPPLCYGGKSWPRQIAYHTLLGIDPYRISLFYLPSFFANLLFTACFTTIPAFVYCLLLARSSLGFISP